MPHASINGQEIFYVDHGGNPGAPAVVLGHGYLMDHTMFQAQVDALTPEFRLITWDERGFGQTKTDGKPFSYWDSAKDCLALMDHLKLDSAIIGGHSQGGFLSMRAALLAPARVRALVLLNTQAGLDHDLVANSKALTIWLRDGPGYEVRPGVILAQLSADVILNDPVQNAIWIAKWLARPKEGLKDAGHCLLDRDDITSRLPEITCPAFILHGSADPAVPYDRILTLQAGLRDVRAVLVVEGAAHAPNVTHPAVVNAGLLAFLREVSASSPKL